MKKFSKSSVREKSKTRKLKRLSKKSGFFNLAVIVVMVSVGVFYLFQANAIATRGYEIDDLRTEITNLEEQNHDLEIKTVELQSIVNLEERVKELSMVEIDKIVHIDKVTSTVAVR